MPFDFDRTKLIFLIYIYVSLSLGIIRIKEGINTFDIELTGASRVTRVETRPDRFVNASIRKGLIYGTWL